MGLFVLRKLFVEAAHWCCKTSAEEVLLAKVMQTRGIEDILEMLQGEREVQNLII